MKPIIIIMTFLALCSPCLADIIERHFLYNPKGIYRFNEGNAQDMSGQGNDGDVTGATSVAGVRGNGFSFDGVGDQIAISNIAVTNALSVAVWAKLGTSTPTVRHMIGRHPGWFISSNQGSSTVRIAINSGSEQNATFDTWSNLGTSAWHHYAGVYDGSTVKAYLDGVLKDTVTKTGNINVTGNTRIGAYWNGGDTLRWIGSIDEVYVFDRALTEDEIKRLYFFGRQ